MSSWVPTDCSRTLPLSITIPQVVSGSGRPDKPPAFQDIRHATQPFIRDSRDAVGRGLSDRMRLCRQTCVVAAIDVMLSDLNDRGHRAALLACQRPCTTSPHDAGLA